MFIVYSIHDVRDTKNHASLILGLTVGVSLDMSISEEKDVEGCIHGDGVRASWNDSSTSSELENGQIQPKDPKITAYPHRWFALAIFISHEITSNMMWITFSPISTIATCYYGVSLFWINSLSWIFMLTYVVLLYPATWVLERHGLRVTAIVGGCLNTAGAWMRFAGSGKYDI